MGGVRWIDHQVRRLCGPTQQAEVDDRAEDRHRREGVVRQDHLDPAEPVVHRERDQGEPDEPGEKADRLLRERQGRRRSRQTPEIELHRLQVHDVHERDVGGDGRDHRMLDDLGIAHPGELGDQERRRAHHRRRELAVGRRRDLHRSRLLRREAGALHQRDGERPGGDGVRDRRSGVDAAHRRGDNRGLCGTTAKVAQQRERELDEVVSRPGLLEDRAEQDEQEDHRRRDPQGDPEDPLGLDPVVPHRLAERRALPADRVRQQLGVPEEDVEHEHARDHHEGKPERAVHRGAQHDHPHAGGDEVARPRDPRPHRDVVLEHEEVQAGRGPERGQDPVVPRNRAARTGLEQRKRECGEEHREREVDEPGLVRVDDDVEPGDVGQPERDVRRDVELEQGPDERQPDDETSLPAFGIAAAGIDLRDEIVDAGGVALRLRQGDFLPEPVRTFRPLRRGGREGRSRHVTRTAAPKSASRHPRGAPPATALVRPAPDASIRFEPVRPSDRTDISSPVRNDRDPRGAAHRRPAPAAGYIQPRSL